MSILPFLAASFLFEKTKCVAFGHKSSAFIENELKSSALSAFWMQRSMSQMNISDEQAKKAYDKLKKSAKDKKKIPSFEQAKKSLKVQLAQEAVVKNLMKQATIKVK